MFSLDDTYFSKLPIEVTEYIWELNHDWAARVINKQARKYIITFAKNLKPLFDFAYKSGLGLGNSKIKYVIHNKQRDTKGLFGMLVSCQCCKRHQINKPRVLQLQTESAVNMTQCLDCDCICRHYSRWLCRSV